MSGFFHVTVPVIDIVHLPIPFQFVNCPNDEVSTSPADDTNALLWFCINEPVCCLLDQDQQNFLLKSKEICGHWVGILWHTNIRMLPTPPLVNDYFPSPSTIPPVPFTPYLEPSKVVLF